MGQQKRRKRRTHRREGPGKEGGDGAPRTFVLRRGARASAGQLKELEGDLRGVMAPGTAAGLKARRSNTLKDFVHVAGPLGVTHFLMLSSTDQSHYLRVARVPRGPTLSFRIAGWSTCADLAAAAVQYRAPAGAFATAPLLVLANFDAKSNEHLALVTATFQGMFPSINARTVRLSDCRRVVLVQHEPGEGAKGEGGRMLFRHFSISAAPSGVSKSVKAILKRNLPDIGHLQDVSEFVAQAGYGSESEGEEGQERQVKLAQKYTGRGNAEDSRSAVRLHEIGPRLDLELVKIQEGLSEGAVLYHRHIHRSPEEVLAMEEAMRDREALRGKRRREQEENVRRKEATKRTESRAEERQNAAKEASRGDRPKLRAQDEEQDDDDDEGWYRQQVGEAPEGPLGRTPRAGGEGDGKRFQRSKKPRKK